MKYGENDALFEARISELARRAESYAAGYTDFLTPKEQAVAEKILLAGRYECVFFRFGGYDGSERNRIFILPEYMAIDGKYNAESIRESYKEQIDESVAAVLVKGSGYKALGHRDYMGALLGLGIERGAVGDILCHEDNSCTVFCHGRIAEFLVNELKKVGCDSVKVSLQSISADFSYLRKTETMSDTVASARFDCVVSSLAKVSRERAQTVIKSGEAELDYFTQEEVDRIVSEGSIISIRGYGKFKVDSLSLTTKKGRLRLLASKYI